MKNVEMTVAGSILTVKVDLAREFGRYFLASWAAKCRVRVHLCSERSVRI